ncbi:MAG TPA: hypothetical protein VGP26_13285 [Actinophytocola sp.]|jgi:hypothetical protein|nr:hypothetical protein [Actinophytocola sp.]
MAETEELADLRAKLKRLERRLAEAAGETDRTQRLLVARLLVVIATIAMFLALSMGWYADIDVDDDTVSSLSGWRMFTELAGADEGALKFAGAYSLLVVLAALAGGAAALTLAKRWVAITLSTLLGLLAAGQLLLNLRAENGEQLAGIWCAVIVIAAAAFAWGNLVPCLREAENAALYAGGRTSGTRTSTRG